LRRKKKQEEMMYRNLRALECRRRQKNRDSLPAYHGRGSLNLAMGVRNNVVPSGERRHTQNNGRKYKEIIAGGIFGTAGPSKNIPH